MGGKSVVMFLIGCGGGWIFVVGKKLVLHPVFLKIVLYVPCITVLMFVVFALSTFGLYASVK